MNSTTGLRIAGLCPTYGRPRLVQNALACWLAQDHPEDQRRLFILDDAGQFGTERDFRGHASQCGDGFDLWSRTAKFPKLTDKYSFLVQRALEWGAGIVCPVDDDDIILPRHCSAHIAALSNHDWSHPSQVFSLYTGRLELENAAGRFHPAIAFRCDAGKQIGFWGDSHRCDFDQQLYARLARTGPPGRPDAIEPPTFVMRWGSTNADHCSGRATSDPESTDWYLKTPISQPGIVECLVPTMDEETKRVYRQLA